MGNILKAMATDHLCVEPAVYNGSPEYQKARTRYCTLGEKLAEKLNEEEKKILEEYSAAQTTESLLYGNDRFIKGFRLGILMMMEVITDEGNLILHEEDSI